MKIEAEFKYRIGSITGTEKRLHNLGFIFIKKVIQEDYYFSPPHMNFARTRKYYLRLRRDRRAGVFAYHIVCDNLKTKEWEVKIDNFNNFLEILNLLNFKVDCVVKKERLIYKKGDIEIMLDKVRNLGKFIEIEYCRKFTRKAEKRLISVVKALGLREINIVSGVGYPDLIIKKND